LPWAGLAGGLAGKRAGIPVFYTEHNNFNRYHFLTRFVSTYSYRNYKQVFMVSEDAFRAADDHFKHRFPCKTNTLLNGVNTDTFQTDTNQGLTIRESLGWSGEHIIIGLAAVYRKQKRIDRWLRIAKQLHELHPAARFLLVGTGPLQGEVDQWIDEYSLNEVVKQVGLQQDVKPYYSAMDIFHMSSDFEGLPVALLEAMSMQLVPVVSRTGGMPELVDAHSGFVYDSDQEEQAVHLISQCISDKYLLNKMKQGARSRVVDYFDLRLMVKQLEAAYFDAYGSS
jgi:glycosyltransferase involved in cell wall biosynthesis